ncbi:MAG: DUF2142 domain-containing protein [Candidatus Hydrogenedentes bacterium]|nr:DUF2142 domain-containing protein [Candidatus Hydrogenedentota bacterium]
MSSWCGLAPIRRLFDVANYLYERPALSFATLYFPFALLSAVAIPPGAGFDERNHIARAYSLTKGHVLPQPLPDSNGSDSDMIHHGVLLPVELAKSTTLLPRQSADHEGGLLRGAWRLWTTDITDSAGGLMLRDYEAVGVYPPIPDVPAAAAMMFAEFVGLPCLMWVLLARVANVLTFGLLVIAGMRCCKTLAWPVFLLALSPVLVSEAATCNKDAATYGLLFLFLLSCVGCASRDRLMIFHTACLAVLALLVPLCKSVYTPILGIVLIIPPMCFGSTRRWILHVACVLGAGLIGALVSISYTHYAYLPVRGGATLASQNSLLLDNPCLFLFQIVPRTLYQYVLVDPTYVETLYSYTRSAWIALPFSFTAAYVVLFSALSLSTCGLGKWYVTWRRVTAFGIAVIALLTLLAGAYVAWGSDSDLEVWGVQGRYFAPILCALTFCVAPSNRQPWNAPSLRRSLAFAAVALSAVALSLTMNGVYVWWYAQPIHIQGHNLMPNGDFLQWPHDRSLPLDFEIGGKDRTAKPDYVVSREFSTGGSDDYAIRQEWTGSDTQTSIADRFGISLEGLEPYSEYYLLIKAQVLNGAGARVSAWQEAPLKRLQRDAAHVLPNEKRHQDFICHPGWFFTNEECAIRICVTPLGRPTTVVWDSWALYAVKYARRAFWRGWFKPLEAPS